MKKFYLLLLICVVFLSQESFAQINRQISGTVTDQANGEALAGASIVIFDNSSQKGTITNAEGRFQLFIPQETSRLTISMIGYETQEVLLGNQNVINIQLREGAYLEEVVVTALGLERNSRNIGYAVQQIDGREVSHVKSNNFIDNLGGRVAGLTVNQGSTGPGSTSKVTIRGESSFTNNNPLFVVDGIPVNNNTVVNITSDAAEGFQEVDFGNGGMDINPDDIESVSVLKGPSAAALYGTRASNGVILIKTKTGAEKEGIGVSFSSSMMAETPFQLPQFQNLYGQGNGGQFEYKDGLGAGINDNITYSYGPKLDAGLLIPQYDSPVNLPDGSVVRGGDVAIHGGLPITPTPFVSQPDNLKNFYNTGYSAINHLSISSNARNSMFRLSLTDLNNKSVIPGVDLKRKTLSGSFTFNPSEKLSVSSSLHYMNSGSQNRPATKYGSENINYALVAWLGRQTELEPMKNYWQPGLENVQHYSYNYTYFDNPYFTLLENRNSFGRDRLFGHALARYEITPELSIQARTGMDYQNEDREFRRAYSSNRYKSGAFATQDILFRELNSDVLINYLRPVNDVMVDLSVGANRMDQFANMEQSQTLSLAQPGVFSLNNAASPLQYFQNVGRKRINSVYGLAKLSFRDYLFIDITGRNDWSSALATPTSAANSSFFYPSVSGALVMSNLFKLPPNVSFLKLRASYAEVGNDTNPFQTVGFFESRTPVNGLPTFSDQASIANANLLPERISSREFGADIRAFNDRLKLDFTYFNSLSKNQIISLPISSSTGYKEQNINGGEVRNTGFEAIVNYSIARQKDFGWNIGVNFSTYKSILESLPIPGQTITLAYNRIYDNVNQTVWYQVKEGGRLGDMYGTGYLKNDEGEFIIGGDGRYIVDNSLIKLGNYNPDFMMGFINHLNYKNWSLSFVADWRQGGEIVSRTQALAGVAGQLIETADRPESGIIAEGVVNTGTVENPVYTQNTTAISAESYYRLYYDRNHEENNTLDASYLKLREVQLGFQFPEKWVGRKIAGAGISLIGRNFFAISKIKHFDPEQVAFQGQNVLSGVEDMAYPTTRSMGIKLNINF
ncbi:SusC/RagA family TonB-linked outer membrane protein [Jiulongibacter sediminis]|jgi:TonB-linked SusC/RagA family outer membrane protein|uniref:SusC/RagA family TonB-linked outer membrane protein n=1 Tax=Jiulongibacter sediminis TaxID=1605367 RepID=UPI0026F310D5|nr:SusC/RagA family TonB-linked outer membrane protein [Jiulongibacter sediminis]